MVEKKIIRLEDASITLERLLETLRVGRDDEDAGKIGEMLAEALGIAKPLALYATAKPEAQGGAVLINGVRFEDAFVGEKLCHQEKVVLYVASCGVEADEWAARYDGFFEQFVADAVKQLLLGLAMERLSIEVAKLYDPKKSVSHINPGSLEVWPLTRQRMLFDALGGVTGDIGVRLTESCLMVPNKSVSGIMFETAEHYENCQLCPRENCQGRRAEYAPMWN
ncbi:MAG: vitamin B12 dependent methionine synthase [Defluviitaleaceae bacterium]|nr:vitamin B12 dependent methionine synthase [Defluviitaleaceae bacterium]